MATYAVDKIRSDQHLPVFVRSCTLVIRVVLAPGGESRRSRVRDRSCGAQGHHSFCHAMVLMCSHLSTACWGGTRATATARWPVVLMHHHEPQGSTSASYVSEPATRRHVLAAAVLSSLARPQPLHAASLEDPRTLEALLRAASTYAVRVDSTALASPVANRITTGRLVGALASQRAIFLGEHHPDERDHLLQAALLRRLLATKKQRTQPIAVGLEAVQRQFQPVLDDYIAARIDEKELFTATDWQRRWYWDFDSYAPIFRICRENGVKLVALDVDSEDKANVELGGLASLDAARLLRYVPDREGFERFASTRAFDEYVSYTLRTPFNMMTKFGQKLTASTDVARNMTFDNFLERQTLRDEAMASASAAWLMDNPSGLLLGLVGMNHVKFAAGVPARTARMLPGGLDVVTSVLLNPTPATTFVDPMNLRRCDRTPVANEACVRNDIEVQNYVLQVPYAPTRDVPGSDGGGPVGEAASVMQAKKGRTVLPVADYMMFSPF